LAEAHLICGSTGAGKTTYALALAERLGGVRFSIDEWMSTLFWMDSPQPLDAQWSMERVARCDRQIWAVAKAVATAGVDVVLDLGFPTAAARARFAALAREAGVGVRLHLVEASADERWRRVQRRNAEPCPATGAQLPFAVDREMFDFVESLWEPPSSAELQSLCGLVSGRPL
jgi:predicted kinase